MSRYLGLEVCTSNTRSPFSGSLCSAAKNDDFVAVRRCRDDELEGGEGPEEEEEEECLGARIISLFPFFQEEGGNRNRFTQLAILHRVFAIAQSLLSAAVCLPGLPYIKRPPSARE